MAAMALTLTSCAPLPQRPAGQCQPFLASLRAQPAEAKAEAIVASGDPYLLAVMGFTLSFPGADESAAQRVGYQILEGTSDAFFDESCRIYQQKAEIYAEKFNRRVLELLARIGPN